MPHVPDSVVVGYLRASGARRIFVDAEQARRHLAERALRPVSFGPPKRLRRDVQVSVGDADGRPVYTITPTRGEARGALVYAHGGGWVNEIALQHWQLAAQVAAQAQTTVVVPIYPLVPFGTAAQVVPAVAELVRRTAERHGPVCLGGDSAGGQIALSTALLLRDSGVTLPRTVLIAPALDLSMSNPGIDLVQPVDPWLGRDGSMVFIDHWRGDLPYDDPRVSPLAGDLRGLGPLTVFFSGRDILYADNRLLVAKAQEAGVEVDVHQRSTAVHVYPLLPTREGREARQVVVQRVRAAVRPG